VIRSQRLILAVFVLSVGILSPLSLRANTVYISQNGGAFSGGLACSGKSTQPLSFLQKSSNWVSNSPTGSQIGPGTTVYLCGTLSSATANTTFATCYQSGTSGSPITFQADSNTVITSPAWGIVFSCGSVSYIDFDGDSKQGVIQNTANGSSDNYPNQVQTIVFSIGGSSHLTISNWTVSNVYIHDSTSDTTPGNPYPCGVCDYGSSSYITLHDNVWHDMNWQNDAIGDHMVEYNDEVYHVNHGIGGGDTGATNIWIHDNNYHDFSNWATSSNAYHLDPIHVFANANDGPNGIYMWNNYMHGDLGANLNACIYLESNGYNPGVENAYAFNNVCITATVTGPGSGCWGMGDENEYHTFFNNTCVVPTSTNYASWITGGSTYVAENNIFECNGAQCMQVGPQYASLSGVSFNYNVWHTTAVQAFCYGLSSEPCYPTFVSYQSGSGQDANSIGVNPQLNSDGSETSNSPTIGKGKNLSSLCTGLGISGNPCLSDTSLGNTRTPVARPVTAAWDIGAFQSGSASQVNPPTGLAAVVE